MSAPMSDERKNELRRINANRNPAHITTTTCTDVIDLLDENAAFARELGELRAVVETMTPLLAFTVERGFRCSNPGGRFGEDECEVCKECRMSELARSIALAALAAAGSRAGREEPLYVVMSDDGKPMLATRPEGEADHLDVVDDDPSPEAIAKARAGQREGGGRIK